MLTVRDVYDVIDAFAPFATQAEYDHSGLQVGDMDAPCTGVLTAVDLDEGVIEEALRLGCNVIVTHHPFIWSPLGGLTEQVYAQRLVRKLVRADLHYIAAHTNVDKCPGGNSESMIRLLGGVPTGCMEEDEFALTFEIPAVRLSELVKRARNVLDDPFVYGVGADDLLTHGALCTGAGAMDRVIEACVRKGWVYVSGEFKEHQLRLVAATNGHLVSFGHFTSEKIFVTIIKECLEKAGVPCYASQQEDPCRHD